MFQRIRQNKRWVVLFSLTVLSSVIAVWSSLYISETFFFDKFHYNKSTMYGYLTDEINPLAREKNPTAIEKRLSDLRILFPSSQNNSQILGRSVNNDEQYTIVVVGDSVVYGTGVKDGERFSALLEKELNKVRPTKVYALAQPGDSIIDNYVKYQKAKEQLDPDLTIFGSVENDLYFGSPDKYPEEKSIYDELRERCPGTEVGTGTELSPTAGYTEMLDKIIVPSFDSANANFCYLQTIVEEKINDERVFFYSFYSLEDVSQLAAEDDWRKIQTVLQRYAQTVNDAGIPVVTPANVIDFQFRSVSARESHPNASTHQKYAQSLAQEIIQNKQ
jgi:hypothetical protein